MKKKTWYFFGLNGEVIGPKCEDALYFLFLSGKITQETNLFESENMISVGEPFTYLEILSSYKSKTANHQNNYLKKGKANPALFLQGEGKAKNIKIVSASSDQNKPVIKSSIKISKRKFYEKNKKYRPLIINSILKNKLNPGKILQNENELTRSHKVKSYSGKILLGLSIPMWCWCLSNGNFFDCIIFQSVLSLCFFPFLFGLPRDKYLWIAIIISITIVSLGFIFYPLILFPLSVILPFLLLGFGGLQLSIILPSIAIVATGIYFATGTDLALLGGGFLGVLILTFLSMPVFLELWTWTKLFRVLFYFISILGLIIAASYLLTSVST